MSLRDRRPRTSTLVLTGLFIVVFALYLYVREPQATGSPASAPSPTATQEPTHTPTPACAR